MHRRPSALASCAGGILARFTFTRYLMASVIALCADMLLFLALLKAGAPPAAAGFAGYAGGLLLHWMISIRFVFVPSEQATHGQRIGFVVSAVIGLALTTGLISGLTGAGLAPALAKLIAIPVSFLAVYAIRKYGVFSAA
ncbi:hypothetical protein L288_07665 [Sphingobium quisquiliarum P25]|uniref:GtrA/DPMS transmembrane domain-containing protein n=1 Tax=Sphingobium quisquiliarum P25 TaxID=1329909 RepID=T0H6C6_9SPHN|nr:MULTISPECIES: GtrA family protein [Sphingobium]EQB08567.1 hypothetical protein L288_07665 [Sphingobium quisquiliarum P25]